MKLLSYLFWGMYYFPLLTSLILGTLIYYSYRKLLLVSTRCTNKTCVITGGGHGLGLKLAKDILNLGAKQVILWDLNPAVITEANNLNSTIPSSQQVHSMIVDITKPEAVDHAVNEVLRLTNNKVDILINNAGIVKGKTILESNINEMMDTFNCNYFGHVYVTTKFLPHFINRNQGSLVFISSASSFLGVNKLNTYGGSKSALFLWAEALKYELQNYNSSNNIHILSVTPFFIDTGMFRGVNTRFHHLLPILSTSYVSKKIIESIQCRDYWLALPRIIYFVPLLRSILPTIIFDYIANILGINHSMDYFIGREPMISPKQPLSSVADSGEATTEKQSSVISTKNIRGNEQPFSPMNIPNISNISSDTGLVKPSSPIQVSATLMTQTTGEIYHQKAQ